MLWKYISSNHKELGSMQILYQIKCYWPLWEVQGHSVQFSLLWINQVLDNFMRINLPTLYSPCKWYKLNRYINRIYITLTWQMDHWAQRCLNQLGSGPSWLVRFTHDNVFTLIGFVLFPILISSVMFSEYIKLCIVFWCHHSTLIFSVYFRDNIVKKHCQRHNGPRVLSP